MDGERTFLFLWAPQPCFRPHRLIMPSPKETTSGMHNCVSLWLLLESCASLSSFYAGLLTPSLALTLNTHALARSFSLTHSPSHPRALSLSLSHPHSRSVCALSHLTLYSHISLSRYFFQLRLRLCATGDLLHAQRSVSRGCVSTAGDFCVLALRSVPGGLPGGRR
jgi:hypothetical protein